METVVNDLTRSIHLKNKYGCLPVKDLTQYINFIENLTGYTVAIDERL